MEVEQITSSERLLHVTSSICKVCKNGIAAQVVALSNGEVWMRKICSRHGPQQVMLSNNATWYEDTRNNYKAVKNPPADATKPVEHGCPFDCGPCTSHEQKIKLPVVTINSACNLDCPICYVHNKNEDAYNMSDDDFKKILKHLQETHGAELDILNLTGGEPTMHPRFLEFLQMARDAGSHRVTICTNGIMFAKDESVVKRIAEIGARVALSFDSFEAKADYEMQGAKLVKIKEKCLDNLEKYGVNTTLIPVMTKGVNDHEIGRIIELALKRTNIRHLEIHTITYTGQGGKSFKREGRTSMYEVLQQIEKTTNGLLNANDFVPSPCAHPLCYQITYLLVDPDGGPPVPFPRFMPKRELYDALHERLYLEPSPALEASLRSAIDRLWAEQTDDSERILKMLKSLLTAMFPTDRQLTRQEQLRAGEMGVKAIYIHSHMDEETFDTERASQCCDSNNYPDGSSIPVCNYNVLYREKEPRFMTKPVVWNERSGGQKFFPIPQPEHHRKDRQ